MPDAHRSIAGRTAASQTIAGLCNDRRDGKRIRQADAFVGEANLNIEMVRNGWAMAHHSGMAAWEAIARENKRGLWRGTFVFPERWRKGERLPQERRSKAGTSIAIGPTVGPQERVFD